MRRAIVVIVGPTAVGKTELSIAVAKQFDGEVISGDSMQVYKGMDIGTAKIHPDEMQGVPHHLIDIREPDEEYSAANFKKDVEEKVEEISGRGRLPIIVGGSGLYIQAALYDYNFPDIKRDEERTVELEKEAKEKGIEAIYQRLKDVDPEQASKIHPNNHRRVIRALEIYETTGKTKSEWEKDQTFSSPYHLIFIGLEMERGRLYERINQRVDLMVDNGLVDEVKQLYDQGFKDHASMLAIGYKEFIPYFESREDLPSAIEKLKQNSRRYAKRQFTWFRNKLDIPWYSITPENKNEKFSMIFKKIAGDLKKI